MLHSAATDGGVKQPTLHQFIVLIYGLRNDSSVVQRSRQRIRKKAEAGHRDPTRRTCVEQLGKTTKNITPCNRFQIRIRILPNT
jgi:hypothetical protein